MDGVAEATGKTHMITFRSVIRDDFAPITLVILDGKIVGQIRQNPEGGFQYFLKGQTKGGEVFPSFHKCKSSLCRKSLIERKTHMSRKNLIDVDLDGLAKLVADRKPRLGLELYQNARDCKGVTKIDITLEKVDPTSKDWNWRLRVVDDNPDGFHDLSHAYTLFANSEKKSDSDAAGMFNMGEKLLIAVANSVYISTTSGSIHFAGKRTRANIRTKIGSDVTAYLSLSPEDAKEMERLFRSIIPTKPGVWVTFNSETIQERLPLAQFEMTLKTPLATSIADDIKYVDRKTWVGIFPVLEGETPTLYEHGIPVVVNNSAYHYVVHQKVPVPFDRDNVPPAYLAKLHTACVNAMHERITPEMSTQTFVKTAMEDKNIAPEAFKDVIHKKHGEKVVIHDPRFPEASKIAVSKGYVVLHGNSESSGVFANNREIGEIKTAQQMTPQAVPYSAGGAALKMLLPNKITDGMLRVEKYARFIFREVVGSDATLGIDFANDPDWPFSATFGKSGQLRFNVASLGYKWFDRAPAETPEIAELILHEFGHWYSDDHLSAAFHESQSRMGAKLSVLALKSPSLFREFRDELEL